MELKILNKENKEVGKQKLPAQFSEAFRPDLIKRAVESIQSHKRQAYGAEEDAGKKASADLRQKRRRYRGRYGKGISRVPRKIMTRRGMQLNWVGAFHPGAVGGRKAHPPLPEKNYDQKINDKERRKAIRSALSAAINKEIVAERGHKAPEQYPFLIETSFEETTKTKDVITALKSLGLNDELDRADNKKVRAGKGKMRGRKYKKPKGPLIIVSKECKMLQTAKNIPGVDVVLVNSVNAELLAPGTHAGRLTLMTQAAVEKLEKENLFM
jgi:large subunit ribosomal protein L4e